MPRNKKRRKLDHAVQEYGKEGFDPSIVAEVESLFRKSFTYEGPSEEIWELPPLESWFKESWCDEDLRKMEKELNEVKCTLSHQDITPWHEHTQQTNRAGGVVHYLRRHRKPELCTQAWCKFHEIVASYNIVPLDEPLLHSVHLCEAPGAFIASLNHSLVGRGYSGNWHWLGNTLNPHFEGHGTDTMIIEDRFIVDTLERWYFGVDNTGDVMSQANLDELVRVTKQVGPVHLVTADGSIDFINAPEEQERGTSQLHYCEIIAALHILSPGGSLVVKMFTLFEAMSASMLFLLNCVFKEVHVFKPATSKSGNSEVYVVARDYRGMTSEQLVRLRHCLGPHPLLHALFPRDALPKSFLHQHRQCCHSFMQWQIQTINENQALFGKITTEIKERLESLRRCCAVSYIQRYDVRPIKGGARVVPLFQTVGLSHQPQHPVPLKRTKRHSGSYLDRQQEISLPWKQRLQTIKPFDLDPSEMRLTWLQSHWGLHEHDISLWTLVKGTRLTSIKSSILCTMSILKMWNLLQEHCQDPCGTPCPHPTPDHLEEVYQELLGSRWDAEEKLQVLNLCSEPGPCLKLLLEKEQMSLCSRDDRDVSAVTLISAEGQLPSKHGIPPEVNSKKHLLSTLISAFEVLNDGDHLLVTFPGLTTRFSAGLFYILYMTFAKVCVMAPSPDSSQQTIVCVRCRGILPQLRDFLTELQTSLVALEGTSQDVLQIMSVHNLYESNFHLYLETTNDLHLKNWINLMIRQQREFYNIEEAVDMEDIT